MSSLKTYEQDHYVVTWQVEAEFNGVRLDTFLKHYNKRRSREKIRKQIEAGRIQIVRENRPHLTLGKIRPSSPLFEGDVIQMTVDRRPEPEVSFDYKILFEDEHLLIIDKPGNLPVHPAGRYYYHSLIVHMKTAGFREPLRVKKEYFLVHRIDRETSGILVIAKRKDICETLTAQFREREVEKRYFALVHGCVDFERRLIEEPIGKPPVSNISLKMAPLPVNEGGLPAQTMVHRIQSLENVSWVECFPKSGRQHQIRVHLDSIGHPLIGDKLYGLDEVDAIRLLDEAGNLSFGQSFREARTYERFISPELEAKLLLPRHALHSSGLRLDHPITGERMEWTSALPKDLSSFLKKQKGYEKATEASPSDWGRGEILG